MYSKTLTRLILASVLLAAIAAGAAMAHEGHTHMAKGTVKAISAEQLDLEQQEGKVGSFVLTPETKYLRGDAAEKREGVVVGERAVVHYVENQGKKVAKEVRLGEK